ncbi:DUF192 domain-containing protein [Oecophyllibacter saccharovorans]|uniref:DUF192 domain-containing protein n=1 Tax=Oecophyllibacter saccharovorans TaxID=2558360 RepID=UPI0038D12781
MCALAVAGVVRSAQAQETPITQAQPPLPTASLSITGRAGTVHHFTVELARTEREQEVGEMFRTHLAPDAGMLFLWPTPRESDMWMRNTLIPLDIVFISQDHRIHAISEDAIPRSEAILSSEGPVGSVLELPGGTTARLGIVVGDRVSSSAYGTAAHDGRDGPADGPGK